MAGALALEYRRQGVSAEDKADDSPVTPADRAAERLIVQGLLEAYPEDGVLGEEGANKPSDNGRKWIIDPIDGTRDFLRGNRFWANLLGFEVDGVVQLGIAAFPAMDEVYFAVRGRGAWRERGHGAPERIQCSSIEDLSRAVACYNGLNQIRRKPHPHQVVPLLERCWAVRSMGGAMDAMLVCSGSAELWIEPTSKPWDLAPLQIIAQESGARYFDYTGADTIYGGNAIICAPGLERVARDFLGLA